MTDADFMLSVLQDGEPHSQAELLRRSFADRGCGLMVHSRAADLRKRGLLVTCERVPGKQRGEAWTYRLLPSPETSPPPQSEPLSSSHGVRTRGSGGAAVEVPLFEMPGRPAWG